MHFSLHAPLVAVHLSASRSPQYPRGDAALRQNNDPLHKEVTALCTVRKLLVSHQTCKTLSQERLALHVYSVSNTHAHIHR